ncbi:MAG: hypothetical protein Q8M22_05395 [Actinomycetota bacterium]|nr:hypothetical protein [Actinomycetota bacterium]
MKLLPLMAAAVLLAACSSEQSSGGTDSSGLTTTSLDGTTTEPTATTDGATSSTAPATTGVATTVVVTTVATTTAPTTAEPCPTLGDTEQKGEPDVLTMSGMVGDDIRVGDHPCFERVVIELAGPGDFPGWGAEYVDDPVRLGESDEFTDIEGDATLLVRMGMWMPDMEGNGYDGPLQIFPTTVDHIVELRQTENFEGITHWAIGLDDEYPFTVTELSSPARLVIDFQVKE